MKPDYPYLENRQMIFQCPLCSSIPDNQRDDFLNDLQFSVREYDKDDIIVTQGSLSETLYIVIRGEVSTEMSDEKGDFMEIEYIKAPNPMSTGFLFAADSRSPVSAICQSKCAIIAIPKDNVYLLMRKYEAFMLKFLSYISNKVFYLSEKLRLVSLRSIRAKLSYFLLKESFGGNVLQLKISREDIARIFSVSRPALVKVMMEMAEEGVIEVNGREIRIIDRNKLQSFL
jgi:CRP-like cAMP-binding protein